MSEVMVIGQAKYHHKKDDIKLYWRGVLIRNMFGVNFVYWPYIANETKKHLPTIDCIMKMSKFAFDQTVKSK